MRVSINSIDTTPNQTNEFKVGFLTMQPGERVVVRFLVDSDEDFDVVTLHNLVTNENKPIRVDCIRSAQEPVSKCPLCAAGSDVAKLEQRVFIRLLQYVQNPDGSFTPKAKIWDRSVKSAIITALKTYLMDYGPLSNIVCSITRVGSGLETKYTVSPNLPGADNYPIDASAFNDFDVVGTVVRTWDADQMNEFLQTGEIPAKPQETQTTSQAGFNPPPAVSDEDIPFDTTPQPATARPRRVYN